MMAKEGHELEGKAPRAQHPALKIRPKIEIFVGKIPGMLSAPVTITGKNPEVPAKTKKF
jgi:hypothetical protein